MRMPLRLRAFTWLLDHALGRGEDLTGVTFMDSSGFGTLLGATRRLRPGGGGLHLAGPNSTIQRMLRLTRLDSIMQVHETAEEAVQAVGSEEDRELEPAGTLQAA